MKLRQSHTCLILSMGIPYLDRRLDSPWFQMIWVRSWNGGCLVTWFCYQMIAKPGNKTATVSWPDPYHHHSIDPSSVDKIMFCLNEVNNMPADALAPCVTRASVAIVQDAIDLVSTLVQVMYSLFGIKPLLVNLRPLVTYIKILIYYKNTFAWKYCLQNGSQHVPSSMYLVRSSVDILWLSGLVKYSNLLSPLQNYLLCMYVWMA